MRIPKIISNNNKEYILVKVYPNYILYKDMITGVRECFTRQELGLIKAQDKDGINMNPEKVRL